MVWCNIHSRDTGNVITAAAVEMMCFILDQNKVLQSTKLEFHARLHEGLRTSGLCPPPRARKLLELLPEVFSTTFNWVSRDTFSTHWSAELHGGMTP